MDYANHDFRLKDSSLYASGGARRGSDDKNLGADADAIDAAVGKVKNVRVREISSLGATLSYTAPDADACTVEYGPSAAWGTGSRSSDGGGDKGTQRHPGRSVGRHDLLLPRAVRGGAAQREFPDAVSRRPRTTRPGKHRGLCVKEPHLN